MLGGLTVRRVKRHISTKRDNAPEQTRKRAELWNNTEAGTGLAVLAATLAAATLVVSSLRATVA